MQFLYSSLHKKRKFRLFLYLNHLFLSRILITQYSIHIYMSFSVYITWIVSHPRFDSTIEFRSGFSKGRTILQRWEVSSQVPLTSWRNETTLQEFPLKKSNPQDRIRGSEKKIFYAGRTFDEVLLGEIPYGQENRYISEPPHRNMRWTLFNC